MSSIRSGQSSITASGHPAPLRVVNWPVRDDRWRTITVLIGCLVVGAATGAIAQSWQGAVAASIALFFALWKLWVPIACELGPRGVTLSIFGVNRCIAWRSIDHLEIVDRGVFICGESHRTGIGALRSFYLPWYHQLEAVTEFDRLHCPRSSPTRSSEETARHS